METVAKCMELEIMLDESSETQTNSTFFLTCRLQILKSVCVYTGICTCIVCKQ